MSATLLSPETPGTSLSPEMPPTGRSTTLLSPHPSSPKKVRQSCQKAFLNLTWIWAISHVPLKMLLCSPSSPPRLTLCLLEVNMTQTLYWHSQLCICWNCALEAELFKVTYRNEAGKLFISGLARLLKAFGTGFALEPIALKAATLIFMLLLQKPARNSKVKDHI